MKTIHRSTSAPRALRTLLIVGLLAGTVAACSDDTTEPTPVPGATLTLIPNMRAEDISADGSTILMTDIASVSADFYFYDVAAKTTTFQASPGDVFHDFATGVSNAGRVSAIYDVPEQAGLWTEAGGWQALGSPLSEGCEIDEESGDQNMSGGWDIDSAGHVSVGLLWNVCQAVGFIWSDAGGTGVFTQLEVLGDPEPGNETNPPSNRATVVSDDGTTAAGWASVAANVGGYDYWIDRWPAIWGINGSGFLVPANGVYTDDSPGEVLAISGNGAVVTGVWNNTPFIWSEALGTLNLASGAYEGYNGYGQAMALNGQVVYGTMQEGFFGFPFPFYWTQAGGVKTLLDIVTENGITIPEGYYWQSIVAASADGTLVVGTVYNDSYQTSTVLLKIPASAYGL